MMTELMIAIGTPIVRAWRALRFWLCDKIVGHRYEELNEGYQLPLHIACVYCGKIWFKAKVEHDESKYPF